MPLGRFPSVQVDIDGVSTLADFEVIEIIDDSNPYPALLGIEWALENYAVINLKHGHMTFEGKGLRVIVPLDPSQGERYTEPVGEEDQDAIDNIYNITTKEEDYINLDVEGVMNWKCDSSCIIDLDEGLENWKSILYELHGYYCARVTKSIRWVGSEIRTSPTFDGLTNMEEFVAKFSEQVPDSQKVESLDSTFRAIASIWWNGHKKNIHSWRDCQNFLCLRFLDQPQEVQSRFNRNTSP